MYNTVECKECKTFFKKLVKEIRKTKTNNHFCSRSCSSKFNNRIYKKRKPEGSCKNCNCQISTSLIYCNNCFLEYKNNKKKKKKNKIKTKIIKKCIDCKSICRGKRCYKCYIKYSKNLQNDSTFSECIYKDIHRASAYAKIRSRARQMARKLGLNTCAHCGYNKHVEIAHIKSIKDFDLDAKISEINHINNIIPLCPNCHWEFDNLNK